VSGGFLLPGIRDIYFKITYYNMDYAKLKKKHNVDSLYVLEVETPGGVLAGYLKAPDIMLMDMFLATAAAKDEIAAIRAILSALWLEGDRAILTDEINFQAAAKQLGEILKSNTIRFTKPLALYIFEVTDEEGNVYGCELKHPTLEQTTIITEKNPLISFLTLLDKIWYQGDERIKTNTRSLTALYGAFNRNLEQRVSNLKKY
jgi:hypothetical protein